MLVLVVLAAVVGVLGGLMMVYSADLPQIDDLERYRPNTTTDLYDVHGRIFGSFALERRVVVNYDDFSPMLRQAVISIEDKNFESHWGVNVFRVIGAAYHDLTSSNRAQGASTLTMQLARNLFLSSERRRSGERCRRCFFRSRSRRSFTKQQIFTLYANQIYLGHGMYGFEAASEYYFSKHAKDLTLPEAALLAGLPKGPVGYSPILNPERAFRRRNTGDQRDAGRWRDYGGAGKRGEGEPAGPALAPPPNSRCAVVCGGGSRELEKKLGADEVHEAGLRVYTTLDLDLQTDGEPRRAGWAGRCMSGGMDGTGIC